uniref:Uncharacterized protein n=1 Tax=Arundo donax TaxID=35708 RepID=A0A0A9B689_ARUDO
MDQPTKQCGLAEKGNYLSTTSSYQVITGKCISTE